MHRWFWKCGILFFLRANYIMGHFKGYFEGAKAFLTPKLSRARSEGQFWGQKSRGPLEISREMAHYVVCPKPKKIISQIFKNQRCIGIFMSLCDQSPPFLLLSVFIYFFIYCFNNDMWRKPREISQFGKKCAKVYHSLYSSTEQLQVALWTYMFFKLGWNKGKSLHTPPLQSLILLSLLLQSLPLRTLRLVSWSVWLLKHIEYLSVLSAGNLI